LHNLQQGNDDEDRPTSLLTKSPKHQRPLHNLQQGNDDEDRPTSFGTGPGPATEVSEVDAGS